MTIQILEMFLKSPGLIEKEKAKQLKAVARAGGKEVPATVQGVETRMKRVTLQRYISVQDAKRIVAKTSWISSSPWAGFLEMWTNSKV